MTNIKIERVKEKQYLILDLNTGLMDGIYSEHNTQAHVEWIAAGLQERHPYSNFIVVRILTKTGKELRLPDHTFHAGHYEGNSQKLMQVWNAHIEMFQRENRVDVP